jgi:orotidine-5'-phosphate decarboxylase
MALMPHPSNPILCAVDKTEIDAARQLVHAVRGHVGGIKLGLEFFTANGAAGVQGLANNDTPVFLDLKFHDIPNTVAKAIRATAGINTFMMTVHTVGGRDMLRAAMDASMEVADLTGSERPLIVGVTVLTSMDQDDLSIVGIRDKLTDQVLRLADLAQSSGLDGVVCSPYEIQMIKKHCGSEFKLVVPGIRPVGSASGDQKRIMTPKQAVENGADYLVIGRPIAEAASPSGAAAEILTSLR